MDPPAGSPLMQAYGHYFKAKCLARRRPLHHSVVVLRTRKTETSLALSLCSATVEELSQPLSGALLAGMHNLRVRGNDSLLIADGN